MVYRGLYSYQQRTRVITLFPNIFLELLCMLSDFAKVFERKVWRVQEDHLHNAARALSSPSRCFQLSTRFLSLSLILWKQETNRMRFSVALVKFHWFGINWYVFNQSECRNCCLYIIIQKITPEAKCGKYFQIWFFPPIWGEKWWRSEHAHASYPGLFFRPLGSAPIWGGKKGEFRDWTSPGLVAWQHSISGIQSSHFRY